MARGKTIICPTCGYRMDAQTPIGHDNQAPDPGDYGICLKCGNLHVFTESLDIREPDAAELKVAAGDDEIRRAQKLIRQRAIDLSTDTP